jgi:TonB family protein
MTTPGGDVGPEERGRAPEAPAPLATGRQGPDGVALLAWSAAAIIVLALAGLAVVGFRAIGEQAPAMADWWKSVTADRPGREEPPEQVPAPLPGRPPEPTSDQIRDSRGDDVAGRGRAGGDAGIVTNPSWQVPPRPGFPELALRRRIEAGRVELQCPVKADGTIRSCWILSETPAGVGFGQAALTSTVRARLQPRTVDGVATGGMIRFSVNFRLG